MITEIIEDLNGRFKKLFEKYPGTKIYGLAQSVVRVTGTETELLPGTINKSGEIEYVGVDDTYPVIIYHKNGSIGSIQTLKNGRGDTTGDIVNTFNNSIVVYFDRSKIHAMPDEVAFALQTSMPDKIDLEPFKNIRILFQAVILNSGQVYGGEYQIQGR